MVPGPAFQVCNVVVLPWECSCPLGGIIHLWCQQMFVKVYIFSELFATHFVTNFRDEVDEWKRAGFATGIGSLIFPSLHYWSSYHILYRPGQSKLELFFFSHYDLISIEIQVSFLQNKFFGLILLAEFGSNGKWKELSVCWKITCSFRLSWKWVASVQRPKEYTLRPAIVASWPLYMVK